ncbi:Uncharacterized conserved protein YecE, DUF72 family [Zhouia amylolytica]|uniref:Uncharacterized conserved protein YecE, DUF72 family n=1 Tax=Zhouia amylolytica TaxID=376730 RepID=A0A1I6UPD1_9FLAO|nr:DUF72 domain-containing protein [Zhouia amylolytica]MCQ0110720.1 DUF72 domain-containing protein [Zhouia amylolytica]SFT03289.1 Uncharacterized conserved protein YecE, DUF72 family [Zhouia amylolytica]
MKFGKVDKPEYIDFTMPADHFGTAGVLAKNKDQKITAKLAVGCAKWNRADLKGFYPRGIKDELSYYSSQFNSIELNATFYRNFPASQFKSWYDRTPEHFKFFPKVNQTISHYKRLINVEQALEEYLDGVVHLKEKLGTVFLQMHNNFAPKNFDRVVRFVGLWPRELPLAIEFRHTDWFNDEKVANELYYLLEENNIANIIVDTAGRRDLMHMRLTNNEAFVRYVGANHASDYGRLDDWAARLEEWKEQGLGKIHFFVHQNLEKESPLLSSYFIEKLNKQPGSNLKIPNEALHLFSN